GLETLAEGLSGVSLGSVAIGRQGRFLAWGYTSDPSNMTPWARNLFLNAVHYLYLRRDTKTVPFLCPTRRKLSGYLKQSRLQKHREKVFLDAIRKLLVPAVTRDWKADRESVARWLGENLDYLYAAKLHAQTGVFDVDQDAKALKTPNHAIESLEKWIDLARGGKGSLRESARRCLDRYVAPGVKPKGGGWMSWFRKMKDRLVFVDTAGFRFVENPSIPGK
ncbi:MAG: hypothetical protein ACYTHN_14495, partial [Planctomycetota bacterium]